MHLKYFSNHIPLFYMDICIELYMESSGEKFIRSQELYFGGYFPNCEATTEINTKMILEYTRPSVYKQFVIYFISYSTEHIQKMTIQMSIFTQRRSDDDVTIGY